MNMRSSLTLQIAAVALVCTGAVGVRAAVLDPCSLLTKDEFSQGQQTWFDPTPYGDFACNYEHGIVYHFSGKDAQARWDTMIRNAHLETAEKATINGIGDSAY